jgi:probable HAF family extracellular repeat protein
MTETKPAAGSARSTLWLSLATLITLTSVAHAQFYAVTGMGTLGGTNAIAYCMNDHEQIVGTAQTMQGTYHAFMFQGGWMTDLGTMGGSNSWAYGINGNGWVVGGAEMPMTNIHAFLCTNALVNPGMMDLGTLGGSNSIAWMINMHDEMVGWAAMTNGSHHAFFMTNFMHGGMMDLGTAGGTNSEAYCINSNRMVVGETMMSDGFTDPIMSTNAMLGRSSMMTMGMGGMGGMGGGGALGGMSWFVNDLGQTAGQAQMSDGSHHAFVSGSGGMMGRVNVDLGTLGGNNSVAYSMNNAGNTVGMSEMSNGAHHAFMVSNALGGTVRMMDLNSMIPTNSGWELMEAHGINSAGQIIGWGMYAGHTNAFLLTPVSAPVMMTSAPAPQIVGSGNPVTLNLGMSAGEPLTYQWMRNGIPIPGATNATYTLSAMSSANAGQYTVTARNGVGTVASMSAAVSLFTMQLSAGTTHLTVAAPTGRHFRIDYSDHLGANANWQTMTNFTVTGSSGQVTDTSSAGATARYYRAVMLR